MATNEQAIADNGQPDPPDDELEDEQRVVERDPTGRYGRFETVLGRGAFKTVFKAFDEEEGIEVAWNQVKVSELVTSREDRDRLFAEIRVLKQLKHKNIMSFYDSWLDNKTCTVNFITELFTSGTLRQYRKRHKHTDDEVLKRWAWQILCGLVYLHGHQPPIIHRDLKCDNIFVNGSEGVVKIGDLGLATLARARTALTVLGTPEFMAPELYDEDYDDRVDVYSFGMCLLELATMEYPYSECKNAAQIYKKVTLGIRPAGLQKVNSPQLQEFIQLCISPKDQRPRARQLLKHPYFDSIRTEKTIRSALGVEATAGSGAQLDGASSSIGSGSRTSSAMAELYHELLGLDAANGHSADGRTDGKADTSPASSNQQHSSAKPSPRDTNGVHRALPKAPPSPKGPSPKGSPVKQAPAASVAAVATVVAPVAAAVPSLTPKGSADASPQGSPTTPDKQEGDSSEGPVGTPPMRPGSPASDGSTGSGSPPVWERSHINKSISGRQFSVCKLGEHDDAVELRLRIRQPEGHTRTVEFDFDLATDTALSIASEMVNDLTLSQEDAQSIAAAIKQILEGLAAAADDGTAEGEERTAVWLAAADRTVRADVVVPMSPVSARLSTLTTPRGEPAVALLATSPPAAIAAALETLPDTLFVSESLAETMSAPPIPALLAHAVGDSPASSGSHGGSTPRLLGMPPSLSLGALAVTKSPASPLMPPSLSMPSSAHHRHTVSAVVAAANAAAAAATANNIAQRLNLETGPAALLKHSRSAIDLAAGGSPMGGPRSHVSGFASSDNMHAALRRATISESEREARRQQANDALRSIEFRCLEGLEGGPLGGPGGRPRGVPMAATKVPNGTTVSTNAPGL